MMNFSKTFSKLSFKKIFAIFLVSFFSVAIVLLSISLVKNKGKLSDFERQNFIEKSTAIMNFYEELENDGETGNYETQIAYAVETLYAKDGKTTFTLNEIQDFLNSTLTNSTNLTELAEKDYELSNYGKNIFYNSEEKTFTLHRELLSHSQIMNTPITKYILIQVQKNKNTYTATYDKYVFSEPYQIINRTSQDNAIGSHSIKDYLNGNGTSLALKELLNENNVKDIKEPETQITLEFEFKENQLKLKNN
jgi:hypothetical protein